MPPDVTDSPNQSPMTALSPAELLLIEDTDYLGEAAERIAAARGIRFEDAVALVDAAWTRELAHG